MGEHESETSLQIKLTVLQTDVQNNLGIAIALVALMGAFIVALAENPLSYQGVIFAALVIIFGVLGAKSARIAQSKRNEMDTLVRSNS